MNNFTERNICSQTHGKLELRRSSNIENCPTCVRRFLLTVSVTPTNNYSVTALLRSSSWLYRLLRCGVWSGYAGGGSGYTVDYEHRVAKLALPPELWGMP